MCQNPLPSVSHYRVSIPQDKSSALHNVSVQVEHVSPPNPQTSVLYNLNEHEVDWFSPVHVSSYLLLTHLNKGISELLP